MDEWKRKDPAAHIVERDLSAHSLPLVREPWIQAAHLPEGRRTPEPEKIVSLSNTLIDEVMSADVIVESADAQLFGSSVAQSVD